MTPVSRKKLPQKTQQTMNELLIYAFKNLNSSQVYKTTHTLLTKTEQIMLQKRLAIILLLNQNLSLDDIAEATGTTRQTVARIRLQLFEVPDKDKSFLYNKLAKWKNVKEFSNLIKKILDTPIKETIIKDIKNLQV